MKEEKKEIKKLGIFSVAKILALFGVLLGILYGLQIGLVSSSNPLTFEEATTYVLQDPTIAMTAYSVAFGWWMIIVAPIVFAILYYVFGLLIALIYNWFSRMIGGVKIYLN